MEFRYMAESPDELNFTMKITMKAKEWNELLDQLNNSYPSWKLSSAITDLLSQARKVFWTENDYN